MWRLHLPGLAVIWIWIFCNTAVKNFVPLGLIMCQRVSFIFMAVWPSVIFLAEWRRHVAAGVWTTAWTSWCCSCESMHENSTGQLTVAVPNWYTKLCRFNDGGPYETFQSVWEMLDHLSHVPQTKKFTWTQIHFSGFQIAFLSWWNLTFESYWKV